MALNSVAGILDGYGGWWVVCAPRKDFRHHWRQGQICIVVPHYKVPEQIPPEDYPTIIMRAELAILDWIGTRNDPDILKDPAVALFLLRRKRTYNRGSVHLPDIVET